MPEEICVLSGAPIPTELLREDNYEVKVSLEVPYDEIHSDDSPVHSHCLDIPARKHNIHLHLQFAGFTTILELVCARRNATDKDKSWLR